MLVLSRHGPGHLMPPASVPSRANIFALKRLGCTHIIATGACGSLRQEFKPGELVVPDQIIDKTVGRPATFFEKSRGPRGVCGTFLPGHASNSDRAGRRGRSDHGPRPGMLCLHGGSGLFDAGGEPDAPIVGRRPDRNDGDAGGEAGAGGGNPLCDDRVGDGL